MEIYKPEDKVYSKDNAIMHWKKWVENIMNPSIFYAGTMNYYQLVYQQGLVVFKNIRQIIWISRLWVIVQIDIKELDLQALLCINN